MTTHSHEDAVRRLREIRARLQRAAREGGMGLRLSDIADAACCSVQSMKQYCLEPSTSGARRIPEYRLQRLLDLERNGWPATNKEGQA